MVDAKATKKANETTTKSAREICAEASGRLGTKEGLTLLRLELLPAIAEEPPGSLARLVLTEIVDRTLRLEHTLERAERALVDAVAVATTSQAELVEEGTTWTHLDVLSVAPVRVSKFLAERASLVLLLDLFGASAPPAATKEIAPAAAKASPTVPTFPSVAELRTAWSAYSKGALRRAARTREIATSGTAEEIVERLVAAGARPGAPDDRPLPKKKADR